VAPGVATSIGPLARVFVRKEETKRIYIGVPARARIYGAIISVFCSDARRRNAEKWHTSPFYTTYARDRRISFFIFHRRRLKRTICFAAHDARPQKPEINARHSRLAAHTPKGWWRWRSGRDDAVLPVFHPCENATSENTIFHRGIQNVARYEATLASWDKSREKERVAAETTS